MKKTNNKKSSTSKDTKLPKIGNNKQASKSPSQVKGGKNDTSKNKTNINTKENSKVNILKTSSNSNNIDPKALKKEEYNEKRKKRLEQEKKEEERNKKVYESIVKEFQEKNKLKTKTEANLKNSLNSSKNSDIDNSIQLPKIRVSEKKTQTILEEGGMLDAYKYLIVQLCKNGLPTGNLFEYSAFVIKNYEKKWKEKKNKMNKDKMEHYWNEKKQEYEKFQKDRERQSGGKQKSIKKITKEDEDKMEMLNRSLQQREINKLISNMDKSRSSIHHQEFPNFNKNKSEENLPNIKQNLKLSISQTEKNSSKGSPKKDNKSKSPNNVNKNSKASKKNNGNSRSPSASTKKTAIKKKK